MRRRDFIKILGGAAVTWPSVAGAQKPAVSIIGYLSSKGEAAEVGIIAGVRKGLTEAGFVEGQNIVFAFRWSDGQYNRLPELAVDLVASKVDVIVASGLPAVLAAKAATSTIPI